MKNNNSSTNGRTISANVKATVNEDGTITITLPLYALADCKLVSLDKSRKTNTKADYKSIVVAESGKWPQKWATVDLGDGQTAGVDVTVLIDNPDYVATPVAPVSTPASTVAKYFQNNKKVVAGNGNSKSGLAAIRKLARTMPSTV